MKKFNMDRFKLPKINPEELDESFLLKNLYLTQLIVLVFGIVLMWFQKPDLGRIFAFGEPLYIALWGVGFAAAVIALDLVVSRWVPPEVTDDGGINELLFRNRPLWHIAVISIVVSFCEELLFRGAIQAYWGPYWTSILFAAIHIRYLQHWLMTGLVFSISYGLGWIYEYTGTLWTPIIAHAVIDFVMGCILRYRRED